MLHSISTICFYFLSAYPYPQDRCFLLLPTFRCVGFSLLYTPACTTESIYRCRVQGYSLGVPDITWQHHQYQYWSASNTERHHMIDERVRDMETDYNMRGYLIFWFQKHTTLGGLYLRPTYFPSCNSFSRTLPCACFCSLAPFLSTHPTPFFEILFF